MMPGMLRRACLRQVSSSASQAGLRTSKTASRTEYYTKKMRETRGVTSNLKVAWLLGSTFVFLNTAPVLGTCADSLHLALSGVL